MFELRRVDPEEKSIIKQIDRLLEEIPIPGDRIRTKLARVIVEERE
jgi:hypothetical protein